MVGLVLHPLVFVSYFGHILNLNLFICLFFFTQNQLQIYGLEMQFKHVLLYE